MARENDDEGGLDESELGEKGAKLFSERMAGLEGAEVEVQEPEEDDELDETPEAPTRKEKRGQRAATHVSARERAAAAEARAAVLAEQLEAERRRPGLAPAPQQPQQNALADIDKRIRDSYSALKGVHAEWAQKAGKLTAAQEKELEDKAIDLDMQIKTLAFDRREAQMAPQRAERDRVASLRLRAPDVYDNPQAHQYALHTYSAKIAAGAKHTLELHDQVMEEARRVVLGVRPRPDAAQRQRASGISAGARPAGTQPKQTFNMPKGSDYDKIAQAAFPKDDPAVARQKWVNTVGKKLLARQG